MKNVNWLIEETTFKENLEYFINCLKNLGYNYKLIKYYDFLSKKKEEIYEKYYPIDSCVIFYGSLQLAQEINKLEYYPGTFCNLKNYECFNYYPKFSKFLLNENYVLMPFGDLKNKKEFLFNILGNNDCLFLRPSNGFKTFTGFVTDKVNFEKDLENVNYYNLNDSSLIVVAEPKNIYKEYRFIICDNKIIGSSQYKKNLILKTSKLVNNNIIDYVKNVLNEVKWMPDIAYSLDIAELKNGELKVIEIGSFSCSGLYECDFKNIIINISNAAFKQFDEFKVL